MSLRNIIAVLDAWIGTIVHPSIAHDRVLVARHRSFISSHLAGGLIALCVLPVYLAVYGQPRLIEALVFAWFVSPVAIALFLSRTGRYELAHIISILNLTGLVTFAAGMTGGLSSFLIAWMMVIPIEAALSASKRVIGAAMACVGVALAGLYFGEIAGFFPVPQSIPLEPNLLIALGVSSAAGYAGGVAISVQRIHQESKEVILLSERRYRLLAENATDMISRHNPNGEVLFASEGAQRVIGVCGSDLEGDGLFDRVLVADRPAFLTAISRAAKGYGEAMVEFRLRVGSHHGMDATPVYSWVEMRCRRVAGENSNAEVIAVTRDIAERKEQEFILLEARDEAEKANVAKTRFLANMSHELRTPLNAIIGFSEILGMTETGMVDEARQREYADLIHTSGQHLLTVVNGILDMSRIEAGKFEILPEPFDPARMIDTCCQMMQTLAHDVNLKIAQNLQPDLAEICADERACKQIMLNLLSNAVKFSEPGGVVSVDAYMEGAAFVISVADTGIGISSEDLPRLGAPFVQADSSYNRNYEGTGLGLSVVKGLVDLHGGSMKIESEPGVGTKVTIRFEGNCPVVEQGIDAVQCDDVQRGDVLARQSA
ncbi:MAG: PAS domain-containing sensor histidine kinase [Fimbriimonadaceae bacterium]|nr:PAS domain-containing sensor histidine kinase [Alphaproteobacteria bacterium]